jgi:hypothetical protein
MLARLARFVGAEPGRGTNEIQRDVITRQLIQRGGLR